MFYDYGKLIEDEEKANNPSFQRTPTTVGPEPLPPAQQSEEPSGQTTQSSTGEKPKEENPYLKALNDEEAISNAALKISLSSAANAQPDRQVEVLKLSKKSGLPPKFIEQHFDEISQRYGTEETSLMLKGSPGVAKWLQNPNNAAIAKDDIHALKGIEDNYTEFRKDSEFSDSLLYGLNSLAAGAAKVPAFSADVGVNIANNFLRTTGHLQPGDQGFAIPDDWKDNAVSKYFEEKAKGYQEKVPELDQSLLEAIVQKDPMRAGRIMAHQFVANAPTQAALIASYYLGYGTAGLVGAGTLSAAQQEAQYRAQEQETGIKLDPNAKLTGAVLVGTLEGVTENLGTFGILHQWENAITKNAGKAFTKEAFKNFGKTLLYSVGAEGNEEFVNSVGQDLVDKTLAFNPDQGLSVPQQAYKTFERAFNAGAVGAFSGFSLTAPSGAISSAVSHRKALRAKEFYLTHEQKVLETKLKERMPEAQKELLDNVVSDVDIYIPAEAFQRYAQSNNENPELIMGELGKLEDYQTALEHGGDVQIPLSSWSHKMAGTRLYQDVSNEIRLDVSGKSVTETQKVLEQENTKVQEEAKKQAQPQAQPAPRVAARQAILQQVKSVVSEIKRLNPQNSISPKQIEAFTDTMLKEMETRAQDLGLPPEKTYELIPGFRQLVEQNVIEMQRASGDLPQSGEMAQTNESGTRLYQSAAQQLQPLAQPTISPLGFYSQVEAEVLKVDFDKMPVKDLVNKIKSLKGVKKEELEWMGLLDWLNAQEGKVSKEDVLNFIRQNGVQVEQTVLSQDFKGSKKNEDGDLPQAADLEWEEETLSAEYIDPDGSLRSDNASDNARDAVEYNWDEDWVQNIANEHKEDFTDENGNVDEEKLKQKVEEVIAEQEYESETERINNGDSVYSQWRFTEINTGWYIQGSGEYEYQLFNDSHDEIAVLGRNEEEAKVQALQFMIDDGVVAGSLADAIKREDITWSEPTASEYPNQSAITRRANNLIKEERARLEAWVLENEQWRFDEKQTPEERKKDLDRGVEEQAKDEARKYYDNHQNPKNKVTIKVKTAGISAELRGNDKKGYELFVYGKKIRSRDGGQGASIKFQGKLDAANLDEAKAKALDIFEEKGFISKPQAQDQTAEPIDPNKPTGRALHSGKGRSITGGENYREFLLRLPKIAADFAHSHFSGVKNYIAHIRVKDFIDHLGRKILVIDEFQADWQAEGQEYGFKTKEWEAQKAEAEKRYEEASESVSQLEEQSRTTWNTKVVQSFPFEDIFPADENGVHRSPETGQVVTRVLVAEIALSSTQGAPSYLQHWQENLSNENQAIKQIGEKTYASLIANQNLMTALEEYGQILKAHNAALASKTEAEAALESFDGNAVDDAPYIKDTDALNNLMLKRMIRLAVEQGYDGVAIVPSGVQLDRWGTDNVSWMKVEGNGFEIVDNKGDVFKRLQPFVNLEEAQREADVLNTRAEEIAQLESKYSKAYDKLATQAFYQRYTTRELEGVMVKDGLMTEAELNRLKTLRDIENDLTFSARKVPTHWIMGSVEQVGGNVNGINIEEEARQRNLLLEKKGERVTTKKDVARLVGDTLRTNNKTKRQKYIERVWNRMQAEDSGSYSPRLEGFKKRYDNDGPKAMLALAKKFDPEAKIETSIIDAGKSQRFSVENGADRDTYVIYDRQTGQYINQPQNSRNDLAELAKKLNAENPGQPVSTLILTDKIKQQVAQQGFPLFQEEKGAIFITPTKRFIELGEKADVSTLLHEMSHFWFDQLSRDYAVLKAIPEEQRTVGQKRRIKLAEDTLNWLGVSSFDQVTREMHERFAEGFETFAIEGKSPIDLLADAFHSFKVWLTNIYKSIVAMRVQLDPEIRSIFDRFLATEEELKAQAEALEFKPLLGDNPEAFGLKGSKAEQLVIATENAKAEADRLLLDKMMEGVRRKRKAFYKEQWKANFDRILSDVQSQKIYRALSILQTGSLPGGSDLDQVPMKIKLSKEILDQAFDKDIVALLPKNVWVKETNEVSGLHPDIAAEMLGYRNGAELVYELARVEKPAELARRLTDQYMTRSYPDLIDNPEAIKEEATQALRNTSNAKRLRLELEILASEELPAFKSMIKQLIKRVPSEQAVKEQVAKILGRVNVKDIKPNLYLRAERKAAKDAAEAFAKGDREAAWEAKRRELLNHELYRAALEAVDSVEKAKEFFKKFRDKDEDLAKTRDINIINAGRAVLQQFGLGRAEKTAQSYVEDIRKYDPDAYTTVYYLVENLAPIRGYYEQIPLDSFQELENSLRAFWDIAKSNREFEIGGQRIEKAKVIEALREDMAKHKQPEVRAGYTKEMTRWEKTKSVLLGAKAFLRRVESWAEESGPSFKKYIFNPVSQAATTYRESKRSVMERYLDLAKNVEKSITTNPINAPELNYTFAGKVELLAALLHTGNGSNFRKLLIGRGWGELEPDGTLNSRKWDSLIQRLQREGVLTKADYDFVQGVWDLNESLKPLAQQAHKKLKGYYFSEITAEAFVTPFGVYRGGYVPAIADADLVNDAASRIEEDELLGNDNGIISMFPTTGSGFTKGRVERYNVPLKLDLRLIPSHLDKVLRFVHIEPTVRQVARVFMDFEFRKEFDAFDEHALREMIWPWLQRVARQQVKTASKTKAGRAMDQFWSALRTRTGLQIMTANVQNTVEQATGFSVAFTKVRPPLIARAMMNYLKSPSEFAEAITSRSAFMRTRTTTQVMEINAAVEDLLLNSTKFEKLKAFAEKHGYFMQSGSQNIVDLIVWAGAYDQAIERGVSEEDAAIEADSIVRATQGSFNPEDISRFEANTAFVRLFTMFYSYFNNIANLGETEIKKVARELGLKKGAGRLLYLYFFGLALPAFVSSLLAQAFSGRGFDDDDDGVYIDDLLSMFFTGQVKTLFAMVPGVGTTANALMNTFNDNKRDDSIRVSPAISALESTIKAPNEIYQAIANDRDKRAAVKDTLTAVGLLTGLPLAPLAKPINYTIDRIEKGSNDDAIDTVRGLISGKPTRR